MKDLLELVSRRRPQKNKRANCAAGRIGVRARIAPVGGSMYVGRQTCIRRGFSCSRDPRLAARELFEGIYDPATSLAIFFASTDYDLHALERELGGRFAGIPLIGCTSAGEITPAGYSSGGIVGFSLSRPDFVTVSATIENLRQFSIAEGNAIVRSMRHQLDQEAGGLLPDNTFAFLLIEGSASAKRWC